MENNNFRKNYGSIMNPLFNFMDLTSLLTWMDMRSLMVDIGLKYRLRLQIYTTAFLAITLGQFMLMMLYFFGYVKMRFLVSTDFLLTMIIFLIFNAVVLAFQIVPTAFINQ